MALNGLSCADVLLKTYSSRTRTTETDSIHRYYFRFVLISLRRG